MSPRKELVGMRLLLASRDRYRLLLMLDPVQHALEFVERRRFDDARWEVPPINGWFGMIDGVFGAIYVAQRQLFVKLNYQTVPIEPDIVSRWENVPFGNRFTLQRASEVIAEVEYGRPAVQAPDLFDRVEEDRDFWLYVHMLLSVPGKRESITALWDRKGVENQMG